MVNVAIDDVRVKMEDPDTDTSLSATNLLTGGSSENRKICILIFSNLKYINKCVNKLNPLDVVGQ